MALSILPPQTASPHYEADNRPSALARFISWTKQQEKTNHVSWVGISVTVMAAVLFPLTMLIILLNGAFFGLIIAAMTALVLVVVTNLAALPTQYTIPCLFIGALIDLAAIVCSFLIR